MIKKIISKIKEQKENKMNRLYKYVEEIYQIHSLIWEAEKYKDYTNADFEAEVESRLAEILNETYAELSCDATYYHEDLIERKISTEEAEVRKLLLEEVRYKKQLVHDLQDLKRKANELVQSCKARTGMSYKRFNKNITNGNITL